MEPKRQFSVYQLVEANDLGTPPLAPGPVVPGKIEKVESMTEFPGVSTGFQTAGPFIDLNTEVMGAHIYLSTVTVWEAAKLLDFVEPEVHQELQEQVTRMEDTIAQLTAELAEAREQQNRVMSEDEVKALLAKVGRPAAKPKTAA